MAVRTFTAEAIINGLSWDLSRMSRERQSKKVIVALIEKNLRMLKGNNDWIRVVWWQDPGTTRTKETKPLSINEELALDLEKDIEQDVFV